MGVGPAPGYCLAEGVRPPPTGHFTVCLYKLLIILKCYTLRKFLMRTEQLGVSDSWNSCPTPGRLQRLK